jgi:predicted NBD/HSP70 family sugar kinase
MARRINLERINVARSNTIRDINRQIILNYIREDGPISRASIAQITELQRSTISLIVDELLTANLVEEVYGESSGGRPPQLLSLKSTGAVALGIDLGKKNTIVGTCDLSGRIIEKCTFPTSRDFNKTINNIIEACQKLIKSNKDSIEGIGISLPGLVESWTGRVVNIPHLNWRFPKIIEKIEEVTGLPVLVENDTNATALAELWLGRPEIRNVRNFVVVLIHDGIGTSIVFDGQLYRGKGGVAGEFGHMTIGSNAPILCAAGKSDCWEAFASERSAVSRYVNLVGETSGIGKIQFNKLVEIALEGDKNAQTALKETAHYIGVGISNLVQGLSPEVTIVVGNMVDAWSLISEDIKKATENAMCQGFPAVNIMPSTLGDYPTLKGAFSLVLANKFASFHIN